MLADLTIHWLLDMSGAVSLACIYGTCNNPEHQHKPWVQWIARNRWKTQSAAAVVVAYITIRMVG